jgi:hypothetical protein
MALSIGDKVIANKDNPGSSSKTKKGMIGSIIGQDDHLFTGRNVWKISWNSGSHEDEVLRDSDGISKI